MRMPVDAIRARMLAGAHAAGFTDVVAAHLAVLGYPGPDNRRPSDLAAQAGMTKQAVNYLLGQLEHLGYLTREHDPDDQRSKRVQFTARGLALRATVRDAVREVELEVENELGRERFERLRELLLDLNGTEVIRSHYSVR